MKYWALLFWQIPALPWYSIGSPNLPQQSFNANWEKFSIFLSLYRVGIIFNFCFVRSQPKCRGSSITTSVLKITKSCSIFQICPTCLDTCRSYILFSIVLFATNLYTNVGFVWPYLNTRHTACASWQGFQQTSIITTRLAPIKLIPKHPAFVDKRNNHGVPPFWSAVVLLTSDSPDSNDEEDSLLNLLIISPLSVGDVSPSSRK